MSTQVQLKECLLKCHICVSQILFDNIVRLPYVDGILGQPSRFRTKS